MKRPLVAFLGLALVGVLALAAAFVRDPARAAFAYLAAFAFAVSVAIGALVVVMIGHVAESAWMVPLRRVSESVMASLPAFAALFLPLAMTTRLVYPWAHGFITEIPGKRAYLTSFAFCARSVVTLGACIAIAEALRAWSLRQDREGGLEARMRMLSGGALPVVGFALTFASFDWTMSLEPDWASSIYGLYVFAGGFAGALGLVAILVAARGNAALRTSAEHGHALGRVLFAAVCIWGYLAFAQFLILWIADIPKEITWYLRRSVRGWEIVAALLVATHFVGPFAALLSRSLKRRPRALASVGFGVLCAHYIDTYWLVLPVHDEAPRPSWVDAAALFTVVGLAGAFSVLRMRGAAPVPVRDARFDDGVRYEAAS